MKIIQRLIPASHTETRPGIKMNPKYITVHETDNTSVGADAEAHARLQERGNSRTASWHLQIDEKEIIQSIPFDEVAWAAGDGHNGPGNRTSIHIEMCVNKDGNYEQTVSNTVEVVKYLMNRFNISINHVVPHKHWTGKNCPRNLLPRWDSFIKRCQSTTNGWVKQGAQWSYYKNGANQTGWVNDKNKWYYLDSNGVMKTGWILDKNKWYYLDSEGVMQTGWKKVKGKWYYLASNGVMKTGWVKDDNKWYYLNSDGVMQTGWIQDKEKTYYLNSKGEMVIGNQTIEGKEYTFEETGALVEAAAPIPTPTPAPTPTNETPNPDEAEAPAPTNETPDPDQGEQTSVGGDAGEATDGPAGASAEASTGPKGPNVVNTSNNSTA
ncbi:N-acetylmuramoyl-L-alanine amidase [Neobacillus rhizosphaerae]|uniref:N-acetylmuramoyl-L-alanine amidase n=1 Tax=Neobacillus rhizosphaerae TaxID=2880965 RepID=UPI003D2E12D2